MGPRLAIDVPMGGEEEAGAARVLAGERAFVLALGGFSLEVTGASLVTHERFLAPLLNYIVVEGVGPSRQAAFFERALDHFFQWALLPRVLTRDPAPPHLDQGLRGFGFRPAEEPVFLLEAVPEEGRLQASGVPSVERVPPEGLDRVVRFWASPEESAEIARSFDVLAHHPNPGESFVPLVAVRDGRDVATALVYSDGRSASVHGVATDPEERGQGVASALVRHIVRHEVPERPGRLGLVVRSRRAVERLAPLGFRPVGSRLDYELPRDVELRLPPPGPPSPPRWRPPRAPAP